ncbi:hypothetical protein halTADL_2143 [Halohasta litchfieldiae]|jgi:hypothetical protein|uniref:Uncharacterized protein n=1 Tax=Halohasta litchfieldiae TaxID=1073996 RepID=A0A1H6TW90_9EURY|nr:hypothetical protein [Halohasta litchfieldiae]ATW88890.1 hypothetical protein halTADL_2143 [Halohasta litchfieldiae]SEI80485.1 hypothetical protein SAMN05444271_108104 [Halohasta litchfieldiae]
MEIVDCKQKTKYQRDVLVVPPKSPVDRRQLSFEGRAIEAEEYVSYENA